MNAIRGNRVAQSYLESPASSNEDLVDNVARLVVAATPVFNMTKKHRQQLTERAAALDSLLDLNRSMHKLQHVAMVRLHAHSSIGYSYRCIACIL